MIDYSKYTAEDFILRDLLAIDRTVLAISRTSLSFLRTALAFFGAGAGLWKFFDEPLFAYLGIIFMIAGVVIFVYGVYRHKVMVTALKKLEFAEHETPQKIGPGTMIMLLFHPPFVHPIHFKEWVNRMAGRVGGRVRLLRRN